MNTSPGTAPTPICQLRAKQGHDYAKAIMQRLNDLGSKHPQSEEALWEIGCDVQLLFGALLASTGAKAGHFPL